MNSHIFQEYRMNSYIFHHDLTPVLSRAFGDISEVFVMREETDYKKIEETDLQIEAGIQHTDYSLNFQRIYYPVILITQTKSSQSKILMTRLPASFLKSPSPYFKLTDYSIDDVYNIIQIAKKTINLKQSTATKRYFIGMWDAFIQNPKTPKPQKPLQVLIY